MKKQIFGLLLTGLALNSPTLFAHHSFSATFNDAKQTTIEGVVTQFSFKNPHILVYTDVTNTDGSVTHWVSEGAAATLMRRAGWSKDSLQVGDMIRITGDSTHDGSPMTSIGNMDILSTDGSVAKTLNPTQDRQAEPETTSAATMPLKLADGRPNLTGSWTNHGMVGGRPIPLVASFSEKGELLDAQLELANDPQVFCDAAGLVRQAGSTPHPIKISQFDDYVVFEYEEYGGRREVYFDDSHHLGIKTHLGDSTARYEVDTLIVETKNLLANLAAGGRGPLSDSTTTLEIYKRSDSQEYGPVISIEMQVTDPENLTEKIIMKRDKMSAGADYEFIENDCKEPLRVREVVNSMMGFFLTSEGVGDGANLGGLDGADAHCKALAASVGQGDKNWQAYLSTTGENGVNARDRIGNGPWYNAKGQHIAVGIDDLHSESNRLTKATAVTERGQVVNGRGDTPNRHDVLTGSLMDGTASTAEGDTSCGNWTQNGEGSALLGHTDRQGGGDNPTSWNSAHGSRGCSQENLQASGGDGLFYCFATEQ